MKFTKQLSILLFSLLLFTGVVSTYPVKAADGPTITTTLTDSMVQKGSKKTFDVWAKNSRGQKIKATVKFNGQTINPTWEDTEKASYTLTFTKEGENLVVISASSDGGKKQKLTYHITYRKAKEGESIGSATWSVELFTIGCGYLVYPVSMPIYEGETAAEQLIRLLHEHGFTGYYGGSLKSSFYLAYIADGTAEGETYNNYQKSGVPKKPKKLNLSPSIPQLLVPSLEETMTFFEADDYTDNWQGYLGEFVFTNGSGWMYSVNHVFPNVGFADTYLSDGDVVRVQFTLGYGADIGGLGSVGGNLSDTGMQPVSGYFSVANKDELSEAIAKAKASKHREKTNVKRAYHQAISVMETLNASQSNVNQAVKELNHALENPETQISKNPNDKDKTDSSIKSGEKEKSNTVSRTNGSKTATKADKKETSGTFTKANEKEIFGTVSSPNEKEVSGQSTNPDGSKAAANGSDLETGEAAEGTKKSENLSLSDIPKTSDRKASVAATAGAKGISDAPTGKAVQMANHKKRMAASGIPGSFLIIGGILVLMIAVAVFYMYQKKRADNSLQSGGTNEKDEAADEGTA